MALDLQLVSADSLALKLLRVTPLITTTILLSNRLAQYFALSTFLPPHTPPKKIDHVGPAFQHWLQTVVPRVWTGVIGIVLLTRVVLILNLFVRPDDLAGSSARVLYAVGLGLSFAHLAVAPKMLRFETRMMSPETVPHVAMELLAGWLRVNNRRFWLVDVPFWLVGVGATVEGLRG
ncbi:hypothetical protein BO70DRAFT_383165 [Aspergillus heteromorphus CBS 117.55]|uniref:Uncharacterized protein n=1 Tax=Aspergillus heteromorphus CBS 117.55 TaxID=1448321 RepID=A0A317UZW1_9EURO|nr:uncharacterized protein BO70DRAFT_383165 [Aspergillus heteromorphus CBS 117.55]PWY66097.1 hypothetical protein BO70DRAFT_383165 [Aspergillus heteromorphus CBS 117.55]